MEVKMCDMCILECRIRVIGLSSWKSWGWSHSGVRRIHLCSEHQGRGTMVTLKKQSMEEFKEMVRIIDRRIRIALI